MDAPLFPILHTPAAAPDGMALLRARSGHYLPLCDGRYAWLIDPADGRALRAVSRPTATDAEDWLLDDPGSDPTRPELVVVWAFSAPVAAEMFREGLVGGESL